MSECTWTLLSAQTPLPSHLGHSPKPPSHLGNPKTQTPRTPKAQTPRNPKPQETPPPETFSSHLNPKPQTTTPNHNLRRFRSRTGPTRLRARATPGVLLEVVAVAQHHAIHSLWSGESSEWTKGFVKPYKKQQLNILCEFVLCMANIRFVFFSKSTGCCFQIREKLLYLCPGRVLVLLRRTILVWGPNGWPPRNVYQPAGRSNF